MRTKESLLLIFSLVLLAGSAMGQGNTNIVSISASVNEQKASRVLDNNPATKWEIGNKDLSVEQYLMLTLRSSGDVKEIRITSEELTKKDIEKLVDIFITYDPMNPGEPVKYTVTGNKEYQLQLEPKYGAHVKISFRGNAMSKPYGISSVEVMNVEEQPTVFSDENIPRPWLNTSLPVEERVELILAEMLPEEKMELIREGWGIPGVKRLGIPPLTKVEAIHGFSYGSGATMFPQSIGLGATWNRKLMETVARVIGEETKSANAVQA